MSDYQGPCKCLKTAEKIIDFTESLQCWALRLLYKHPVLDEEILNTLKHRVSTEVIEPVNKFARCLDGRKGEDYKSELENLPIYSPRCDQEEHVDINITYYHYLN